MWGIETYISNGSGGHIKAVLEKAEMAWMMKNQAINITTGVITILWLTHQLQLQVVQKASRAN